MAPNPNLHSSNGLPVCLSGGITIPIAFSTEIADHDRRRKVFKKKIFGVRQVVGGVQLEMRSNQRSHYQMRIVDDAEDLATAAAAAAATAGDMSSLDMITTTSVAKAA